MLQQDVIGGVALLHARGLALAHVLHHAIIAVLINVRVVLGGVAILVGDVLAAV